MAVPLAQISLNIPPALNQNGFVSGIPIPPAPANPPNAVDVKAAVKLKAAVAHELVLNSPIPDAVVEAVANYETDVILARQIALAPQPALPAPGPGLAAAVAPPAPAAPMAGVALILNAIAASNQALGGRLDLIDRKINDIQRDIAINGNIAKGTGLHIPYAEVLFLDGTRPTQPVPAVPAQPAQPAQPGRPGLPFINNVTALRALQGPDATNYLIGYGIAPIPHLVQHRLVLIAQYIGCVVDIV